MAKDMKPNREAIKAQIAACRRALSTEQLRNEFDTLQGWEQACMAFGVPMNKRGCKRVIELSNHPKYHAEADFGADNQPLQRETVAQRFIKALTNPFKPHAVKER